MPDARGADAGHCSLSIACMNSAAKGDSIQTTLH
jgi:hypothetical protein